MKDGWRLILIAIPSEDLENGPQGMLDDEDWLRTGTIFDPLFGRRSIPEDARLIAQETDIVSQMKMFLFRHDSFPERWRGEPVSVVCWDRPEEKKD